MKPYYEEKGITIYNADCREAMRVLADASIDAVVTDPPYELGFMGKGWDRSGIAYDVSVWEECLRVLKPGGHLLAFGGSRTYHRLACAIEDGGFEIRDQIQWIYGSGFPKSLDVSKAIDAAAGAVRGLVQRERWDGKPTGKAYGTFNSQSPQLKRDDKALTESAQQWNGWGTALKPAHEPIVLARKPLIGTVAENVLQHGTGGLNIDGCRIGTEMRTYGMSGAPGGNGQRLHGGDGRDAENARRYAERSKGLPDANVAGRWPANVIHDGSDDVLAGFPETASGGFTQGQIQQPTNGIAKGVERLRIRDGLIPDSGSAARFFYCAKASKKDRGEGNNHPTVKPTQLMRYLCRLITPPNGVVLDPFGGSGSTAKACRREGFNFIMIEQEAEYCALAVSRLPKTDGLNFEAVA